MLWSLEPTHRIRLLGRFAVARRGEEIPGASFGGRLARRLLRMLAVRRGEFVSKDVLGEGLWPDRMPSDPAANLEVLVSRLRRALEEPSLVLTGPGGYSLAADPRCVLDAEEVLEAVTLGRAHLSAGRLPAALVEFERAFERWGGEPLAEDAYEDWASEFRSRFSRTRQEALEGGAVASLGVGDGGRARTFAELAVHREPLREGAVLLLVRALAESGDQAGALAAFAAFRERYAEELGLDPSVEAADIHERVLRGDPLPPLVTVPGRALSSSATGPRPHEPPFVGRERELAALLGSEPVVFVRGASGAGKSRLLHELSARVHLPVIYAKAFLPDRDEPWSLARSVLAEVLALDSLAARAPSSLGAASLVEVLPELGDLRDLSPAHVDPRSRHALALLAAVQMVQSVAREPIVLVIDDLQWADVSSLRVLSALATRVGGLRLVAAFRSDEVEPASPADSFVDEMQRAGPSVTIMLGPLEESAIRELAGDDLVGRILAEETDGTPLAVAEALRLIEEGGPGPIGRGMGRPRRSADESAVRAAARTGQTRAVEGRIQRLPGGTRTLLELVAVAGRELAAGTLARAAGRGEGTVLDGLDSLEAAGLARSGDRGWVVAHDSIAEVIVARSTAAQLVQRHGAVAGALAAERAEPSEVAMHLAAAGDVAGAAGRYEEAATIALRRFANPEAAALAADGLSLHPSEEMCTRLLSIGAEAHARTGELATAKAELRTALASIAPGPEKSNVLARLAMVESGSEDFESAAHLVDLALAEAAEDTRSRAHAHAVGAIVDLNRGLLERSEEHASTALALFEALGDASGSAGILDGRAMAAFLGGRITQAARAFDRVARLFLDSGELMRVGTPRSTRGHALVFMGRPGEGLTDVEQSLELARSLGHAEGESYALWHRAEALAALGRAEQAVESASAALGIAERIGHREWTAAALRGLGIASEAAGDLAAAEATHRRGLGAAEGIPLFVGWAAARLAICLVGLGRLEEAEPLVERALRTGPPLSGYEARLAEAGLRAAQRDPRAGAVAAEAAQVAERGGHLASAAVLAWLAGNLPVS